MRRRAADAVEVEPVEVEPVEVEPVEVEPVELEPLAFEPEPAPARDRPPPRPFVWIAVVLVVAVVWAGVAFATRDHANRKATPAVAATAPATAPVAPVAPPERLPASFVAAFANIGTGRFAVVVDGNLYTLDGRARASTLVDLGERVTPVSIEDQSGRELMIATPADNLLVDTTGLGVTTIASDQSALSSHDGLWWFIGANRTLSQ